MCSMVPSPGERWRNAEAAGRDESGGGAPPEGARGHQTPGPAGHRGRANTKCVKRVF